MEQYKCYTADYAPYFTADINGWKPIIQTLSPRHYKRGSIICQHYGEDQNVVLIQTGLVSMSFLHESGIERIHFLGSTGYVFGFRSCLSGRSYGGALTAITDVSAYKIPSEVVSREMQKNEEFFRFAMFGEYERGMVYSRKLEFLALPTNIKKVAALLLCMAYRTGHFRDGGTIIPIRMTHELIAKIIYSDRVSVSRAVSELEKRGLIRLRNSEYCVLDFVGLTDIAEE